MPGVNTTLTPYLAALRRTRLLPAAEEHLLAEAARSGRRHPVLPVGLGLVLGGSIANLIDRVRLGRVTDFLDFDAWPAFNLADTFIVVGVALLFGTLVLADRSGRMHGPRDGEAALQRR